MKKIFSWVIVFCSLLGSQYCIGEENTDWNLFLPGIIGSKKDCAGVIGGTAYLDNCDICVGGNTGNTPCTQDCSGVWGGTAAIDNCGVCVGGTTGQIACTQDCNGVWGGTATVDSCGICGGDGTTCDNLNLGVTCSGTCGPSSICQYKDVVGAEECSGSELDRPCIGSSAGMYCSDSCLTDNDCANGNIDMKCLNNCPGAPEEYLGVCWSESDYAIIKGWYCN